MCNEIYNKLDDQCYAELVVLIGFAFIVVELFVLSTIIYTYFFLPGDYQAAVNRYHEWYVGHLIMWFAGVLIMLFGHLSVIEIKKENKNNKEASS